jgi:hypothetical protein
MTAFNDYVSEGGVLTENGKQLFEGAKSNLSNFLNVAGSSQELIVLGSILMKEVSELISAEQTKFHQKTLAKEALWQMSDEEFEGFLHNKYPNEDPAKDLFLKNRMTNEELERYSPILVKRAKGIGRWSERFLHPDRQPLFLFPEERSLLSNGTSPSE